MGRFIVLRDRNCWRNAERLAAAPQAEAKATKAYRLPCRYVIHTPGPIWHGGTADENRLLASCYRNCLAQASALGCKTVAFPSISTGVYHFPVAHAARIAIDTIQAYLQTHDEITCVTMVCFDAATLAAYQQALEETEPKHA